jgi:ABC-2 type transport system ATP-binding protein
MEAIIEIKDLTKKYGDFTAVNQISFDVKKGEIFAFL